VDLTEWLIDRRLALARLENVMWPFKDKLFTGVEILITNHIGHFSVQKVFDAGSGPYIHTYLGKNPRYLAKHGKFEVDYHDCNGDAASWRAHIGDPEKLNWK